MTTPRENSVERRRLTGQHGARTGGRSERVVREVLDAALAELARVGYAALRVEDVAAQAGVNKTTIYRRWPTKAALVGAALRLVKGPAAPPETGSLRGDLLALARHSVARSSSLTGTGVVRMIMSELDHPEVGALFLALREEGRAPWITVLERATRRGELPAGSDPRLIAELILGAVSARLRLREPIDEGFLEATVDLVVLGAQHGGAVRR